MELGMNPEKKLNYDEARKLCYEAVYLDGTDKLALQRLLNFSIRYGEIRHVGNLIEKLRDLGVGPGNTLYEVDCYSGTCQAVADAMKNDDKSQEKWSFTLDIAKQGLLYSKQSLYLRIAIVKCLIQLKRIDEAKEVCYELLRDAPKYVPAMLQEAVINFIRGEFEVSLSIFERINRLEPGNPEAKVYLEKAKKFVHLEKTAKQEIEDKKHSEAALTLSIMIDLGTSEDFSDNSFLVQWYNNRAMCYAETKQACYMEEWISDCLESMKLKRTAEAEALLGLYYKRKRELEDVLEKASKESLGKSVNEYQIESTSKHTCDATWFEANLKMTFESNHSVPMDLSE